MEERAVFAAGKVDPLGYADSDSRDGGTCRCCACVAFERDGRSSIFCWLVVARLRSLYRGRTSWRGDGLLIILILMLYEFGWGHICMLWHLYTNSIIIHDLQCRADKETEYTDVSKSRAA